MNELTPFDARPDPELGAALRDALDGPDADRFLARLRRKVLLAERDETSLDVLARWAPAGLIAATAAGLAWWLLLRPAPEPADHSTLIAAAPVRMEVAPAQPETDVLVTSLLEGR